MSIKLFEKNYTEENKLEVKNYPYGWKRTSKFYWVETKKGKGDRLVTQTINPNTRKLNKPKKSTYSTVICMGKNEKGHITYMSLEEGFADKKEVEKFLEKTKNFKFTNEQKQNLNRAVAIANVMKHVTYSIKPTLFKNKITGEIRESVPFSEFNQWEEIKDEKKEEEQEQIKKDIFKAISYETYKLNKKEGVI